LEQPHAHAARPVVLILALTTVLRGSAALPPRPAPAGEATIAGAVAPAHQAAGSAIVVEVRNGSRRRGLARVVTRLLRERGIDVVYFGSAGDSVRLTQILVRRGDPGRGHEVARALGTGVVRLVPDTLLRVDATVLLGADYTLPKGAPPF